jgi:hypothetical protein
MAAIINKESKLTEAQQKEIVQRCNEAYDRGGVDALHLVIDAAKQIAIDQASYAAYSAFTLYVVEAVRQKLAEAVNAEVHDQIPEEKLIKEV